MPNQYNRYFINLIACNTHCAINGKEAIGRCKIETRANDGKIYIWVQNLKPNIYDIYLINANKNDVKIGELKVDMRGYAELNFDFNAENILNTGININNINVIAFTLADKKNEIVMEGYKNQKIEWQNNFKSKINENENKKINESNEKNEIEAKTNEEETKINTTDETFKEIAGKINKELKALENYKFMSEDEIQNLDTKKNDELEYIFQHNTPMSPFQNQKKEIKWVRLALKELSCLPIDSWTLINHPFIFSAYYKNKHMLLGKNISNSEYILGLPDTYQPEYKTLMSKLGFVQFKSCQDKKAMKNDHGYWLMPIYF